MVFNDLCLCSSSTANRSSYSPSPIDLLPPHWTRTDTTDPRLSLCPRNLQQSLTVQHSSSHFASLMEVLTGSNVDFESEEALCQPLTFDSFPQQWQTFSESARYPSCSLFIFLRESTRREELIICKPRVRFLKSGILFRTFRYFLDASVVICSVRIDKQYC